MPMLPLTLFKSPVGCIPTDHVRGHRPGPGRGAAVLRVTPGPARREPVHVVPEQSTAST